jgi:formylglycine-generating enzyme required for sulfatase activity
VAFLVFLSASRAPAQTPPSLSLDVSGGKVQITVTADAGSPCSIQFATNLPASQWFTLTNATTLGGSAQATDLLTAAGQRFYRSLIATPTNMDWARAGTFVMGSPTNELERNTNELQHTVTFTNGFFIGKFLVTQSNYLSLIGANPSYYTPSNGFTADLNRPVERVSWFGASNYCVVLTQQEQSAGRIFTNWVYRLPTESEWEFACRAGTTNAFYLGDSLLSGTANFDGEYEYINGVGDQYNTNGIYLNETVDVGGYQPNALGLYDMAGNVWEWCQDWSTNYPAGSVIDPQGPANGSTRVFRGGSLNETGAFCRSAQRNDANPSIAVNTIGFRVVLALGP